MRRESQRAGAAASKSFAGRVHAAPRQSPSESLIRVSYPSLLSESLIRVFYPSLEALIESLSESIRVSRSESFRSV